MGSNSSVIIDTAVNLHPQPFWLKILNQRGTEVESLLYKPDEDEAWVGRNEVGTLLAELHEAARRQVLQIDDVVDTVLRELKELPPF